MYPATLMNETLKIIIGLTIGLQYSLHPEFRFGCEISSKFKRVNFFVRLDKSSEILKPNGMEVLMCSNINLDLGG